MALMMFTVFDTDAGERLDKYLAASLATTSRSTVQRLIVAGDVLVNGDPQRSSYAIAAGDTIVVHLPDPEPVAESSAPALNFLYEDDALLVVDKPAGLVVHEASGHRGDTLVSVLLAQRPAIATTGMDPRRPGIVHRLDRDTSGVLAVALSTASLTALQRQFRRREVAKQYLALVYGSPAPARAAIEAPIARDEANRARMAVSPEGRFARTEYEVLERLKEASLISVNLMTGRTHQIRVHMASIGYPVVGDRTYGRRREALAVPRQMLHAQRLTLTHPVSGERMSFEAPVPADMLAVLERLRAV
ncbi:MAG: RluA family pseudouridine synthase [Anaerolineae bacterium]